MSENNSKSTGHKRIAVSEEIHKTLKIKAKEANRSIKEYIEYLIENEKASRKDM